MKRILQTLKFKGWKWVFQFQVYRGTEDTCGIDAALKAFRLLVLGLFVGKRGMPWAVSTGTEFCITISAITILIQVQNAYPFETTVHWNYAGQHNWNFWQNRFPSWSHHDLSKFFFREQIKSQVMIAKHFAKWVEAHSNHKYQSHLSDFLTSSEIHAFIPPRLPPCYWHLGAAPQGRKCWGILYSKCPKCWRS